MAVLLGRAGHRIRAVAGGEGTRERAARFLPGVPLLEREDAARSAEVVLLGTPDAAIEPVCTTLSRAGALGPDRAVVHLSGATGLDALGTAEASGTTVLSVHPLMTCPSVEAAIARVPGSAFAVTARSPLGFELGERLAAGAGVPDPLAALAPLQRATLENVEAVGPGAALTGPAVRGDALTVERNLRALAEHAPEAVRAYVTLADLALDLATASGRLTDLGRAPVEEVLARWR